MLGTEKPTSPLWNVKGVRYPELSLIPIIIRPAPGDGALIDSHLVISTEASDGFLCPYDWAHKVVDIVRDAC